jgi:hypothetical protein
MEQLRPTEISTHFHPHFLAACPHCLSSFHPKLPNTDRRFLSTSSGHIPTGKFAQRCLSTLQRHSTDLGPHHVLPRAYGGCSSRWKLASSSGKRHFVGTDPELHFYSLVSLACCHIVPLDTSKKDPSQLLGANFLCCSINVWKVVHELCVFFTQGHASRM